MALLTVPVGYTCNQIRKVSEYLDEQFEKALVVGEGDGRVAADDFGAVDHGADVQVSADGQVQGVLRTGQLEAEDARVAGDRQALYQLEPVPVLWVQLNYRYYMHWVHLRQRRLK